MRMEKVTKAFQNLKIRKTGINIKSSMDNTLQILIPTLFFFGNTLMCAVVKQRVERKDKK